MRQSILALTLLTLACSSVAPGDGTPTGTDPAPPAVLRVRTGDAQQATPGSVVPIAVTVQVVDSTGKGVAGVPVAFHVDSGEGTIAVTAAVTSASGSASPGAWQLGAGAGRNVITASSGTLAPVQITAVAAGGVVNIPSQTIGTGGGTMVVNTSGSPINGFKLQINAGSFAVPQEVHVTTSAAPTLTLPNGAVVAGPMITITTTSGGLASHPMLVTVPMTVPAGMFPVLAMIGPNGIAELMPTFSYNSTSVTAWTRHLDASRLPTNGAGTLRRGDGAALPSVPILMPLGGLYRSMDTYFTVGVDNWEFHPVATVLESSIMAGMVLTQGWYYSRYHLRPALFKLFPESAGVEFSNRKGIRWATLVQKEQAGNADAALKQVASFYGAANQDDMTAIAFLNIRATMSMLIYSPVLTTFLSFNGGSPEPEFQIDAAAIAVDRHSPAHAIAFTVPVDPGSELEVMEPDHKGPIDLTFPNVPGRYTAMLAAGLSQAIDIPRIESQYQQVVAGTIGDGVFPTYQLMHSWGNSVDMSAVVTTPSAFWMGDNAPKLSWAECVTCVGVARPSLLPPGTATVAGAAWHISRDGGASWGVFGGGPVIVGKLDDARTVTMGGELFANGTDGNVSWLDYKMWTVKRLAAAILPLLPNTDTGTDFSLTFGVTGAPANIEYFWDYGDGKTEVSTTAQIAHRWTQPGTLHVTATLRDKTTKEPFAQESTDVTVKLAKLAWRLTSLQKGAESSPVTLATYNAFFTDQFNNRDEVAIQQFYYDNRTMTPIEAKPSDGVIREWISPTSGATVFTMQYTANGAAPITADALGADIPLAMSTYPGLPTGGYGITTSTNPQTGTTTIDGVWFYERKLHAVLSADGKTLSGTFRIAQGGAVAGKALHWIDYSFTATKVP